MFEKKEATAEDIALILQTLWRRAEDIPCTPLTRLSFHAMLLLAAIGGFRPGVVENIKYRQVSIQIVRDPKQASDQFHSHLLVACVSGSLLLLHGYLGSPAILLGPSSFAGSPAASLAALQPSAGWPLPVPGPAS